MGETNITASVGGCLRSKLRGRIAWWDSKLWTNKADDGVLGGKE